MVNREGQEKYRPHIDLALDLDGAPVVPHILVGNEQAKPGSVMDVALMFGGKVGVKDIFNHGFGDTLSIVSYLDTDILRFFLFLTYPCYNFDLSPLWCKLQSIW